MGSRILVVPSAHRSVCRSCQMPGTDVQPTVPGICNCSAGWITIRLAWIRSRLWDYWSVFVCLGLVALGS